MKNVTDAWAATIKYFHTHDTAHYDLWIAHLNFVDYDRKSKILKLSVSNQFVREQILSKFRKTIEELFAKAVETDSISLEVGISEERNLFADEITEKQVVTEEKKERPPLKKAEAPQLNPRYTFERFVVGINNKLAHGAATQISLSPGKAYNPFYIYGGVGLGKTHIMHAIANAIYKQHPHLKIICCTAEQFIDEYSKASFHKTYDAFRTKFRTADVLLLDDVQFLEKKPGTLEELFNTFEILHKSDKQIILTCDKLPKELKDIPERLISRFTWGLVIDIKHPDLETRKAIVIKKVEEADISSHLENSIIDFLAENITTNIRDIESAVNKVKLLIQAGAGKITTDLLKNSLTDVLTFTRAQSRHITAEILQQEVATHYRISLSDLKSTKRNKEFAFPRHMAMYLAKELLKLSYQEIGNEFSGRDHSTVVASCKKAEEEIKNNPSIRNDYEDLLKKISRI